MNFKFSKNNRKPSVVLMVSNQALLMWFQEIILFYKIINGLAEVPFEGIEAYKDIKTKQNKSLRQISHSTSSMVYQSFSDKLLVHGTGLLLPKLRHWQALNINF